MTDSLSAFLGEWTTDPNGAKPLFQSCRDLLESLPGVKTEFKARPGVSHSLRGIREGGRFPLFVLVDVIDDEPAARWLSVCFYAALVADPEERGDLVPGGLSGEDARCFDIEDATEFAAYLKERIREAYENDK